MSRVYAFGLMVDGGFGFGGAPGAGPAHGLSLALTFVWVECPGFSWFEGVCTRKSAAGAPVAGPDHGLGPILPTDALSFQLTPYPSN